MRILYPLSTKNIPWVTFEDKLSIKDPIELTVAVANLKKSITRAGIGRSELITDLILDNMGRVIREYPFKKTTAARVILGDDHGCKISMLCDKFLRTADNINHLAILVDQWAVSVHQEHIRIDNI